MFSISKVMRAAVYRGPNDIRIETVPVPRIGRNELLVKVAVCGVCPTDIKKIHYGTVPPPRIFGHETAGTIVKVGPGLSEFKVGERVALHHHVPCLDCHACRHRAFAQCETYKRTGITAGFEPAGGGFAEYVRVMPFVLPGVVKIPSANSFEEGAMLEPVNTVLKAVARLSLLAGDTVLVVGQGPIGLMFTRLLHLKKMKVMATDLMKERLKLARTLGAEWASTPTELQKHCIRDASGKTRSRVRPRQKTLPGSFDAAVLAVPSDAALKECLQIVRGAGQILLFAHTKRGTMTDLDLASICVDEKDLIGSYSADITLQSQVSRLVFSRQLDVRRLISHQFKLEETSKAIALAARPSPDSLKILVNSEE
jgi:L-iditol 2-dehydrogenase